MTPNSFAYIVFLVIGALIYHPLPQKAKKPFLLLLNFMFYAIGGVKFLPLLALTEMCIRDRLTTAGTPI